MAKLRNLSTQFGQMKQMAGQLKKDKDAANKKLAGMEKELNDAMNKIQVEIERYVSLSVSLSLYLSLSLSLSVSLCLSLSLSLSLWVRRVVGNIWCVGAGEPMSRLVMDENSRNPRKVDKSSLARRQQC